MTINIKSTGFTLTPAIKDYLTDKTRQLEKLLGDPESALLSAELSRLTAHHHNGDVYRAEINLRYRDGLVRAEKEAADLYAAIDLVKDELTEELTRKKDRSTSLFRRGARLAKRLLRRQ